MARRLKMRGELQRESDEEPETFVSAKARRLVLAHYVESLIDDGSLASFADAARMLGITRARMTQVMDLTLLPVAKQEAILGFEKGSCLDA